MRVFGENTFSRWTIYRRLFSGDSRAVSARSVPLIFVSFELEILGYWSSDVRYWYIARDLGILFFCDFIQLKQIISE